MWAQTTYGEIAAEQTADPRPEQALRMLQEEVAQAYLQAREAVFRYLLTLGLHPSQAQEITQDVFLRLYVARRDGEAIQNTRAWVFRVAHNLGLNLRAREATSKVLAPEFNPELPDRDRNPEEIFLERERLRRIHRAIQDLSEQQRRCLYLRAEGLRYREIAGVLGISCSTVGEFLQRAIARLRKVVS